MARGSLKRQSGGGLLSDVFDRPSEMTLTVAQAQAAAEEEICSRLPREVLAITRRLEQ
jgi:hypothetical protein